MIWCIISYTGSCKKKKSRKWCKVLEFIFRKPSEKFLKKVIIEEEDVFDLIKIPEIADVEKTHRNVYSKLKLPDVCVCVDTP